MTGTVTFNILGVFESLSSFIVILEFSVLLSLNLIVLYKVYYGPLFLHRNVSPSVWFIIVLKSYYNRK